MAVLSTDSVWGLQELTKVRQEYEALLEKERKQVRAIFSHMLQVK